MEQWADVTVHPDSVIGKRVYLDIRGRRVGLHAVKGGWTWTREYANDRRRRQVFATYNECFDYVYDYVMTYGGVK